MKSYPVVAIFWEDHVFYERSPVVKPKDAIPVPTLTIGALYDEDDKVMIVISNIERYQHSDEATYMVILKSTVVAKKEYGKIKLRSLRK